MGADMLLRDLWYLAATSDEIKSGALVRRMILGEPVVLARPSTGNVFALRDICPHRAAPLSAGRLVETGCGHAAIECPYHGWTFKTDGQCANIPSLVEGQDTDPSKIKAVRYPIFEDKGLVWIYMAADPKRGGEPIVLAPDFSFAPGLPQLVERMDFDCHIDHAVVGLMDPAHGPYVHQQWWWRSRKQQLVKAKAFEPRVRGFAMVRHAPSKNSRAYAILGGAPSTEITFQLPGLRWEHIQIGQRSVIGLTCLTPESETKTKITQIFFWNVGILSALKPLVRAAAKTFLKQDGDMVNLQQPGLAHNPTLIWIDDADTQAKWYHQLRKAWAKSREEGTGFENPVKATTLRWRS
jgi:phenylpropionate dioxygenase-like ring-hydroxylating dioxygenase large terminal subunit